MKGLIGIATVFMVFVLISVILGTNPFIYINLDLEDNIISFLVAMILVGYSIYIINRVNNYSLLWKWVIITTVPSILLMLVFYSQEGGWIS